MPMIKRALIVAAAVAAVLPVAPSNAAPGDYRAYGTVSAVHVSALTTASSRAASLDVGVANAVVDSRGLVKLSNEHRRPIVASNEPDAFARGHSTVLELGAFLNPPDAAAQVAPWKALTDAPGGSSVNKTVLKQSIAPAAFVELLRNESAARWRADGSCVVGAPIADGRQHLARVDVLETGSATADGFSKPVAMLHAPTGGEPRSATHGASRVQMMPPRDGRYGLETTVSSSLAPVTFLRGTPNEFTVEVDGPAFLTASATGKPGGAEVTYRAPLVSVIRGNDVQQVLPGSPVRLRLPDAPDAIADIKIGTIDPLTGDNAPGGGGTTSDDGTHAAAQAHVVEVKILDLDSQDLEGVTVALGHMEASAVVPAGGIDCTRVLGVIVERDGKPDVLGETHPRTGLATTVPAGLAALGAAGAGAAGLIRRKR